MDHEQAPSTNFLVRLITRAVVCIAILFLSITVAVQLFLTKPRIEVSAITDAARSVIVIEAKPMPVRRQFTGYGTAKATTRADVSSRVTSTVLAVPAEVREGRPIAAGAVLARLDPTDFEHQVTLARHALVDLDAQVASLVVERSATTQRLDHAQQEVALAEAELARVTEAMDRGAARQREVDAGRQALLLKRTAAVSTAESLQGLAPREARLRAQHDRQQASIDMAEENLARCTITSPIDGVLQAVDVKVGEQLAAGARVARVVDLHRIEVPLRVPASSRSSIAPGDEVVLRHGSAASRRAPITRIAPEDDVGTRTATIFVEWEQDPDDPDMITPGTFLHGTVTSRDDEPRWVVPRRAVRGDHLLVVRDGGIRILSVVPDYLVHGSYEELGLPDTQWVVLLTPLEAGDLVVVNPSRSLGDGMPVRAILATEAMAAVRPADAAESTP